MTTLKQEIKARGITGDLPAPDDNTPIQELDGQWLLELQAAFGHCLFDSDRSKLVSLINNTGPVLFAALLVSTMEDYEIDPNDADAVIATKDILEAETSAIGMVRSVASAMGVMYGDIAVAPSDAEIDADTDINPVKDA